MFECKKTIEFFKKYEKKENESHAFPIYEMNLTDILKDFSPLMFVDE